MRQIKFRVWDTKSKQFLKEIPVVKEWLGSYIDDPEHAAFDDPEQMDPFFYPENLCRTFDDRLIYQQWTGLTDKDGKDIYEGDIISNTYEDLYGEIKTNNFEVLWISDTLDLHNEYAELYTGFVARCLSENKIVGIAQDSKFKNFHLAGVRTKNCIITGHIYNGIDRAN